MMTEQNNNAIGIRKRERKLLITGLLFTSPWIIGFLVFQLYPILASFYYSMTDYNLFAAPKWVGLDNYTNLFKDDKFYLSMYNTLYMTIVGVVPHMAFALIMALLLNTKVKGQSIYRTIYFLPTLVPAVAGSLLWMWLLNSQYGFINLALEYVGIAGPNWLIDPDWTKPSLVLMGFW